MMRSRLVRLLNFLRIFCIVLIVVSLFNNSAFRYLDIFDLDQIEFSDMSSETETEKEIEKTEVDQFMDDYLKIYDPDPSKCLGYGLDTSHLFNSHGDVTTPPPETVLSA